MNLNHMVYSNGTSAMQEMSTKAQPSDLDIRKESHDAELLSKQKAGPSCPIIQVTVALENGDMAAEILPHFYTAKIQPGTALTICTRPEADVDELYLPPGFFQKGNQIIIPDKLMPSQPFLMVCKIRPKEIGDHCSFPVLIHGIWHCVS